MLINSNIFIFVSFLINGCFKEVLWKSPAIFALSKVDKFSDWANAMSYIVGNLTFGYDDVISNLVRFIFRNCLTQVLCLLCRVQLTQG